MSLSPRRISTTPAERRFVVGEIVRHTGEFLRSAGWCLDVPINGRVLEVKTFAFDRTYYRVEWSDGSDCAILGVHMEPCPRCKKQNEQLYAATGATA